MPRKTSAISIPQLPSVKRDLSLEQWSNYMRDLKHFGSTLTTERARYQIVVGRAFVFGREKYGRAADKQVAKLWGNAGTLANWGSVARRIPRELDKYSDLTFEDYRALAKIESDPERIEWAKKKLAQRWSGRRLDAEIAGTRLITASANGNTANTSAQVLKLEAPGRKVSHDKFIALAQEWLELGQTLQARGDQALADAYFDCAARILGELGE